MCWRHSCGRGSWSIMLETTKKNCGRMTSATDAIGTDGRTCCQTSLLCMLANAIAGCTLLESASKPVRSLEWRGPVCRCNGVPGEIRRMYIRVNMPVELASMSSSQSLRLQYQQGTLQFLDHQLSQPSEVCTPLAVIAGNGRSSHKPFDGVMGA